jgi:uncharacterized membrane protein
VEDDSEYNYLIWNLFLGFVPFLVALLIQLFEKHAANFVLIIGSFVWLLFYPNAPYMITDLIHVHDASPTVIYDTLMIFSFSTLSLFFGFYSIKLMQKVLNKRIKVEKMTTKITNTIIVFTLILSSFGIYLGRILRLNSWDVFTEPLKTMGIIFDHLFPVTKNPVTYAIIIIFTLVQGFMLFLMRDIDEV